MTAVRNAVQVLAALANAGGAAVASSTAFHAPFNLDAPTLGGNQFWADEAARQGWRIQQNALTDHYRLLDTQNIRRAWGSLDHCRATLDRLRPPNPDAPGAGHTVMLLHGITPLPWAFFALKRALAEAGYYVVAVSYPSTRRPLSAHADQLERLLDGFDDTTDISFVTHSMGAPVLRELLARPGARRGRLRVRRSVMIAPPNQGSAIARLVQEYALYQWIYGPAGQQLTPEAAGRLPGLAGDFAIIAGGDHEEGYNPLLPGDDDGTVAVTETRLGGAQDFLVVNSLHSSLSNHRRAVGAVLEFLENGRFESADDTPRGGLTE